MLSHNSMPNINDDININNNDIVSISNINELMYGMNSSTIYRNRISLNSRSTLTPFSGALRSTIFSGYGKPTGFGSRHTSTPLSRMQAAIRRNEASSQRGRGTRLNLINGQPTILEDQVDGTPTAVNRAFFA